MKYYTIKPPDSLNYYVRCFWVLESNAPSYTHREIAGVFPELLFHYKGRFDELKSNGTKERSFISGLHGQSPRYSRFHIDEPFAMFGICLYPYTLPLLFGIPAKEITGEMPDVQSILGSEGDILEDRIMTAAGNAERIRIASTFLIHKLREKQTPHPPFLSSVQRLQRMHGDIRIADLARMYCLSPRHFERKFKHYTGFSPKLFARLTRFYAAIDNYFDTSQKSLTEIAVECGYYDQSHFIQDFKMFSGHNPGDFFYKNVEGTEWLNASSDA